MLVQRKLIAIAAATLAAGALAGCADTRDTRLSMGELSAQRLLDLADVNKDGNVSKDEFLKFMGDEFDRLDKNKDQRLSRDELQRLNESLSGMTGG
jgi:hypothetical protein